MAMDRNNFIWLWAAGLLRGGRSEGEALDGIDAERPGLMGRFLQLITVIFVIAALGLVLVLVIGLVRSIIG